MKKFITLFTMALLYSSCSDSNVEPNWSLYDPSLKGRIDNSDCIELQSEFNAADENSERNRARTGEGNYLLMDYIDSKMKEKNCYSVQPEPDKIYSKNKVYDSKIDFKQLDSENDILGSWKGSDDLIQIKFLNEKKYLRFNDGPEMELQIVLSNQGYIATSFMGESIVFQALFLIDQSKNHIKIKRLIG